MHSATAKDDVGDKWNIESLVDFYVRMPCEKAREPNMPKCFGTSDLFFCGCMTCPRRKACEKLVSPWNFD